MRRSRFRERGFAPPRCTKKARCAWFPASKRRRTSSRAAFARSGENGLGPNPALYLAIDPPVQGSLSGHGFYFDLTRTRGRFRRPWLAKPGTWPRRAAISRPPGFSVPARERGSAPAGVAGSGDAGRFACASRVSYAEELPPLAPGFYADKVYVLPVIPAHRETRCRVPRGLEAALDGFSGARRRTCSTGTGPGSKIPFPKGLPVARHQHFRRPHARGDSLERRSA